MTYTWTMESWRFEMEESELKVLMISLRSQSWFLSELQETRGPVDPRGSLVDPMWSLFTCPSTVLLGANVEWAPEWTSQWSFLAAGSCCFPRSSQGMISSRRQTVLPGCEGPALEQPTKQPSFQLVIGTPQTCSCTPCQGLSLISLEVKWVARMAGQHLVATDRTCQLH